jgi:hypothetical protein
LISSKLPLIAFTYLYGQYSMVDSISYAYFDLKTLKELNIRNQKGSCGYLHPGFSKKYSKIPFLASSFIIIDLFKLDLRISQQVLA